MNPLMSQSVLATHWQIHVLYRQNTSRVLQDIHDDGFAFGSEQRGVVTLVLAELALRAQNH